MKIKNILITICVVFLTFLLGITSTLYIIDKYPNLFKETITKLEKDVTITETGISESVDKVYDSVVVISNYKRDTLYSQGSGFIYNISDDDSYIITNNHVIEGGTEFKITYTDGEVLDAQLLGSDEYSDIAVLKVKTKEGYNNVQIGDTSKLKIGDTTFTVGAPLDNVYSWTVTRGIISGKERLVEISTSSSYSNDYVMNVLQTDAAVNSGNSGGPLCNSNGEVIGVISLKISSTGVEGMGFAIPIEVAIEKTEQIINGKSSEYPYLGISMLNVSEIRSYPRYYGYLGETDLTSGVMIVDIENNSSAANSNLKQGDIIIKINDSDISNIAYLRYELYKHKVGDTITITYERDGKEQKTEVKLLSNNKTI